MSVRQAEGLLPVRGDDWRGLAAEAAAMEAEVRRVRGARAGGRRRGEGEGGRVGERAGGEVERAGREGRGEGSVACESQWCASGAALVARTAARVPRHAGHALAHTEHPLSALPRCSI
jgi:hypothetical protein